MTVTANEAQIRNLLDRLTVTNPKRLAAALADALHAERRCGTDRPDGYPTSHDPNGGGHSHDVSDPTQRAALQLLDGRPTRSEAKRALDGLQAAVTGIDRFVAAMARLDAERKPIDTPACQCCKRAGLDVAPEIYGDVAGRLPTEQHLCRPCHKFIYDHGHQPTVEQLRWHANSGQWRVRV